MKKDFRKNNGAAFIVVILVIIIVSAGGFAAFLGIRMAVTGDSFLAPLEEWGWIEAEETEKKKSSNTAISEEATKDNVTHYQMEFGQYLKVLMEERFEGATTTSRSNLSSKEKAYQKAYQDFLDADFIDVFVIDLYAKKNELVELDMTMDLDPIIEPLYNAMSKSKEIKEELEEYDIDDYEDFKNYCVKGFTTRFSLGLGQQQTSKSFEELIDEDDILDLLMDEMNLGELGFTRKELKKCLTVETDSGKISISFVFSDDMNEMILDYIDDNMEDWNAEWEEKLEELEDSEYNEYPDFILDFKFSKKTYVKDFIDLYNEALEWTAENDEDVFDIDDEELLDVLVDSMKIKTVK